ncbi:DUF7742 family protein [Phaeobacter inhibens]|uniref:DUF7742 family protein n=1 Tax=Phaeobacter inhibens TaxID=221822 RepID=UPI0021A87D11|nr:hypothetical protein [Phaeobacter inhibens]UWR51330.1 hypothetical protein K4F84_08780 [Phaeobacter inhibens]UWR56129.1 hypothetical protein K4F89_13980 [Phaeobacter inhibens]UWR70895.1 hypothetical protein K4L00_09220 [Phaeobacter inhibens]UWR94539.1 hypothetical protein K4K99_08895 [Phaeobacter inhibens]UWS02451.1 hypothetical protein K4K94_08870 [Phaeobacter inhibens]
MRRPVLPGDITSTARALLAVAPAQRRVLCERIFAGAGQALRHTRRHRRLCPDWGDGSLSAAARKFPLADEPFYDAPQYLSCTRLVLAQLARHVRHNPE